MMFMRTRRFALCCLSVGIASLLQPAVAWAQLDEHCTVSILNRTAQVKPDGSWRIENIPAGFGQVRARATCVVDGITLSGESQLFDISPNILAGINADITFEFTTPIPQTLALTAGATTLFQPAAVTSLTVMASYADGPPQNVTLASRGTTYLSTNPAIATVDANGLVTAVRSGTVLIRASNEGTAGLITIQVLLAADTDGDGIADDIEVREGLNPNDPTDGLQDTDHDGLSNRDEIARGTELRNPDTDGDSIADGEEVVAGADGFVTNPLLADTDGDGVRDALEIATGTDPTNSASFNLALAMSRIDVTPLTFVLTVNSIIGEASVQLAVIGRLTDGTSLNLTATQRGTNYASSDLNVCNFGSPDGRVFAANSGPCTITVTNSGFSAQVAGTVTAFTPTPLGSVAIPGYANNVDVNGSFAYVAAGSAGLQVVSVADPTAPVIVAAIDTPGNANDVRVAGNIVYVADGASGLRIFDVSTPQTPVALGALDTAGEANDVIVSGNLAFVADGNAGVQIIDVSNPAAPTLIRTVDTPGTARGVDVDGTTLVVADDSPAFGLRVIDITNPATASIVGNVSLTGEIIDVDLSEGFAYVAAYTGGVHVVDVRVPSAPAAVGNLPGSAPNGFVPRDVQVAGRFALFAEQLFANAVAPIVDVSTPSAPVLRDVLDFGQDYAGTGIALSGPYVFWTGQSFFVGSENGVSGTTRLFIGQYISLEDRGGVAPTVVITEPIGGTSVIEGNTISVRANATDDVAVSLVRFEVNGQPAFTDTSEPFEARVVAPPAPGPMVLGATAIDFGGNTATAVPVQVNVIPDPLTTVTGRVVDANGAAVAGAAVTVLTTFSSTTGSNGAFSINNVPTVRGNIVVSAAIDINGTLLSGQSQAFVPVPGGSTNVGDLVVTEPLALVSIVPADSQTAPVGNCIPFGDNVTYGFTGFIYRNVPPFQLRAGGHFSFDLGSQNDVVVRRNIYFAVANANPAPGGNPQNIRALAWTQVASDSQVPQNPRGDTIRGNYELTYTAEAPFNFPGGGFIVGVGGTPPGTFADGNCDQVLVYTHSGDSSEFFHKRFYFQQDQPLGVLDNGGDNSYLGGIVIQPNR